MTLRYFKDIELRGSMDLCRSLSPSTSEKPDDQVMLPKCSAVHHCSEDGTNVACRSPKLSASLLWTTHGGPIDLKVGARCWGGADMTSVGIRNYEP